ncbi:hypothetical protein ACFQ5F_09955 [Kroppenstedtia eburnea]|nr:hypothetical protein [Kroppenstedtia eburnea]
MSPMEAPLLIRDVDSLLIVAVVVSGIFAFFGLLLKIGNLGGFGK